MKRKTYKLVNSLLVRTLAVVIARDALCPCDLDLGWSINFCRFVSYVFERKDLCTVQ